MKVRCERNCIQNVDGYCTRSELDVSVDGTCEDFVERVKFEAFRDDNVVVFDDVGLPFVMVRFSGEEHYVERDEFFTRDQVLSFDIRQSLVAEKSNDWFPLKYTTIRGGEQDHLRTSKRRKEEKK